MDADNPIRLSPDFTIRKTQTGHDPGRWVPHASAERERRIMLLSLRASEGLDLFPKKSK